MSSKLTFLVRQLRAEGPTSTLRRTTDGLRSWWEWNRSGSLTSSRSLQRLRSSSVLHLSPTAPKRHWGGFQTQLANRREYSARTEPFSLILPTNRQILLDQLSPSGRTTGSLATGSVLTEGFPETRNHRFEEAVLEAFHLLQSEVLHLENPTGLPMESLAVLAESIPLVVSLHDHAWYCPRPHLNEQPVGRFCSFCSVPNRCSQCLSVDFAPTEGALERYRSAARKLLMQAKAIIVPSRYLSEALLESGLFTEQETANRTVVIPPMHVARSQTPPHSKPNPSILRVAFLGGSRQDKGVSEFTEIVNEIRHRARGATKIEWYVYGTIDSAFRKAYRGLPNIKLRGYWRPGSLGVTLSADGVGLVLFPGNTPETFSLVLSEVAETCIPVLARSIGAFSERLASTEGALFPAHAGHKLVADLLMGKPGAHLLTGNLIPSEATVSGQHQLVYSSVIDSVKATKHSQRALPQPSSLNHENYCS